MYGWRMCSIKILSSFMCTDTNKYHVPFPIHTKISFITHRNPMKTEKLSIQLKFLFYTHHAHFMPLQC